MLKLFLFVFFTIASYLHASVIMEKSLPPEYLYKVLSLKNWKASEHQQEIKLSEEDKEFIHLSKEDQLARIIEKYWSGSAEYVILKVETSKLPGKLVFEANPGGTNKYYHLYNGSIPSKAIVEFKIVKQ